MYVNLHRADPENTYLMVNLGAGWVLALQASLEAVPTGRLGLLALVEKIKRQHRQDIMNEPSAPLHTLMRRRLQL